MNILLLGATGCTGSYLLSSLLQQTPYTLNVWVRDPARLGAWARHARIQVWTGGLEALSAYRSQLADIQVLIDPVTAWGGPETFKINVQAKKALFQALDPQVCQQIHYFSTASLLDSQHQVWPQAFLQGTEYIRSKAVFHHWLQNQALPVSCYFPTLIIGGQPPEHPLTPLSAFLPQLPRYLPWLRFFKAQGKLHFIHAEDIARLLVQRILTQAPPAEIVLGNPAISLEELMQELLAHFSLRSPKLRLELEKLLPWLLPLLAGKMTPWDRFSLHQRHLHYKSQNAATYGLHSDHLKFSALLSTLGVQARD